MRTLGLSLVVVLSFGFGLSSSGAAQDSPPAAPAREAEPSGEKARVAKTVEEMRKLAAAFLAYITDYNLCPAGTLEEIEKALAPAYIEKMPRLDAWETPFRVEVTKDRMRYRITSAGADRKLEARGPIGCPEDKESVLDLTDPARDLVLCDGEFVQLVK